MEINESKERKKPDFALIEVKWLTSALNTGARYNGGSKLHSEECLGEAPNISPQRLTH